MEITEYLLISAVVSCVACLIVGIVALNKIKMIKTDAQSLNTVKRDITEELRLSREEADRHAAVISDNIGRVLQGSFSREDARLAQLQQSVNDRLSVMDKRISDSAAATEARLEHVRDTVQQQLAGIREDNSKQLAEMRNTVDEKLQKTLEDKIGQSFKLVSERLEMVYTNLGEMKNLAEDVGDLKKVLANVKTRGIFGELQLGAILEQILSPEQYDTNVVTKQGSSDPVEFAVKFPGESGETVYLPIDSKFPMDVYENLLAAYDSADKNRVNLAANALVTRIRQEAKKIRDKYIDPPHTTDFAVMFLPVEGLYAEVVRCGLVDVLQQEYRVSIAGPTTMSALLNSLQMGFRTLAIQKRSSEVWKVLGEVRTEFDTFAEVLTSAQSRIVKANEDLDKLIGVRTRQIQRRLKDVSDFQSIEWE